VKNASEEWRFEPRLDQLRVARSLLGSWLGGLGIAESLLSDAVLVVSELVTNGVVHDGGGPISLRAQVSGDDVRLEVITLERPDGHRPPPEIARIRDAGEGGQGLRIVNALTSDFSVRLDGQQRHVSCRLNALTADR
jgi:anti-sigma regulatory factor (Ser/Thr protein kinase)